MVLRAEWGFFVIDIKIHNSEEYNHWHADILSSGSFACARGGIFKKHKIILKCIPIRYKGSRHWAIKEWFLLKIASGLEIGPKIEKSFGFDILMFSECLEFAMEFC